MSDFIAPIQWYPGHMAKARRLLSDQLKRIDLVIELCDARLPRSSRNPELIRLSGRKRHILLLNKADLADAAVSRQWLKVFQQQGVEAHLTDAKKLRGRETIGLIETATRSLVEKAETRGMHKTVRAMVVGIPNVGKSTLINRLYGRSVAEMGDRPGVTRSNQWVKVSPYLELLDTPGLLWPRLDDQLAARRLCYIGSVKDEVVDQAALTVHLLEDLCDLIPQQVAERFHLADTTLRGVDLLDAVCRGRGWLLRGGACDYDRCCSVVPDEFRAGKLGRITLERPEDFAEKEDDPHDRSDEAGTGAAGV